MNAPPRRDQYKRSPDEKMCTVEMDEKIPNANIYTLHREDHTMGNMVRMELLREEKVRFAGYYHPHPLENRIVIRVQTTDKSMSPDDACHQAIDRLKEEYENLAAAFEAALNSHADKNEN